MMTILNCEQLIEFSLGSLGGERLRAVLWAGAAQTSITDNSQPADF